MNIPRLFFDMPWLLAAALILPLLVVMLRRKRTREREVRLSRFADRTALHRLVGFIASTDVSRTVRLGVVALLCGLAFGGPRWGVTRGPATARGIDMAIAIDASLSMLAPDERPSRLERVKQEVRRLRSMSRADRVALIAFAGRSYILTPLTGDDGAIELFLENLDPSVVGQAGSSLSRTIRQGTDLLLASNSGADRALVIFSDGEAFESREDVEAAADEAGKKGINLVTVGFGTEAGTTIPVRDGSNVRPKRDEEGNIVVTRYTPEFLEAAAKAANGTFIPASASDKASRVRASLRMLRTARRAVEARDDHVPRFLWLLLPALALLLYDTSRGERRRTVPPVREAGAPKRMTDARVVAFVAFAILPVTIISCAREPDPAVRFAEGDIRGAVDALRAQLAKGDSSNVVLYNLGSALLGADSLTAATEILENVRRNAAGEVRMRSRFNAGLALLRLGRDPGTPNSDEAMAAARAAYRAFLEERPSDLDAKWNFELALRKPPPNQDGGGGGGDNDEPQDQQDEPEPSSLDQRQAEALLNSAAREERDVQNKKQRQGRVPPQGKDW